MSTSSPDRSRRRLVLIVAAATAALVAIAAANIIGSVRARHDPDSTTSRRALIRACRAEVAGADRVQWSGGEEVSRDGHGVYHTGGMITAPVRASWRCTAAWRGGHWEVLTAPVGR